MRLGEKLRYLREVEGTLRGLDREITQQEVVRLLKKEMGRGISQSYLSQIENGARPHLTNSTRMLLATFFKVFPNGIVWSNDENGSGYDAVLFGTVEPTVIDVDQWQERLDRPDNAGVRQSLEDVGFHSAVELLSTYAARAADLGAWMSDAQINTDRNLRLQYLAGLSLNNYAETSILNEITRTYRFPTNLFVGDSVRVRLLEDRLKIRKGSGSP